MWVKLEHACIANARIWFRDSVGFCVVKLGFWDLWVLGRKNQVWLLMRSDALQRNLIWEFDKIKGNTVTPIG